MGIHNYAFNNLDAKLSNDSYWDFFLSTDQRDFNQEVIYSTEIMNYSAQTVVFDSSFYSTRLPVYIDLNDPQCNDQLEMKDLQSLGGISEVIMSNFPDSNRTPGLYFIYSHCPEPGSFSTTNFSPTVQGHSNYNCDSNYMNFNNLTTQKPVVGQGASFYVSIAANGSATLSASTIDWNNINGGYGYQINDRLIIPDSSLGGGGGVDLAVTITDVNYGDVSNEGKFYSGNTVLSKMGWSYASVTDDQKIKDIGLTGLDNGLSPTFTGNTQYLATSIPTTPEDKTFNPRWWDYRMKMHQVTGYTSQWDRYAPGTVQTFSIQNGTNSSRVPGTYTIKSNYTGVVLTNQSVQTSPIELVIVVDSLGTTTITDITIKDRGKWWSINDTMSIPSSLLGYVGASQFAGPNLGLTINTVTGVDANAGVLNEPVTYGMRSDYDRSGFFYNLYGGFFQGTYNLFSYGYQVLPKRMDKGWTVECLLKVRSSGSSWNNESVTTLNNLQPSNEGLFFYFGARSENKFWNCYNGETGYTTSNHSTDLYNCTGTCTYTGVSADTCQSATNYACSDGTCTDEATCIDPLQCNSEWVNLGTNTGWTYNDNVFNGNFYTSAQTEYNIMSNNFGLRLSGGPEYGGYKLGYRVLRFTGDTSVTGSSDSFACSGGTYATGYTIEEAYSPPICTGLTQDSWIKVDAVFKRDYYYITELQKLWKGGTNLITTLTCEAETFEMSGSSATTTNIIEGEKLFLQNIAWTGDRTNRNGTLILYVNSRPVLTIKNFEEVIPRRLNELPEKQLAEPFSMSWGGGSQGLYESLTLSGSPGQASLLDNQILTTTLQTTGLKAWNPIMKGNIWTYDAEPACNVLYCSASWSSCVANGGVWTQSDFTVTSTYGTGAQWVWVYACAGADYITNASVPTLDIALSNGGEGFTVGDILHLNNVATNWNQPVLNYTPFTAEVTQTSTPTFIEDIVTGSVTINTTTNTSTGEVQKGTLYYKEQDYQQPVVSGETYDVFVKAYKVSGDTTLDMGISATTTSTHNPHPGPEVKYFWQNQELPTSTTGDTLLYYSYKATLTGDLFLGPTPGTVGEMVVEKVVFSKQEYRRDVADENMLLQKHFGGSYMGGISQMRFYIEPLDASELIHNYYVNMERYGLEDCVCGNAKFPVEGCDTEYAIYTFPVGIDTLSLDFGYRMIRWDYEETENLTSWSGTTNNHDIPMWYSSQESYCTDTTTIQPFLSELTAPYGGRPIVHKCFTEAECVGTGFGQCGGTWHDDGSVGTAALPRPKFPFTIVPNKPFTIHVTRINPAAEAKITFTGKRVR